MNAWFDKLYETFIESGLYDLLFEGVYTTLLITLGALLIGVSRTVAAEFTFFLAIPVMFGASLLKLLKFGFVFSAYQIFVLLAGCIAAFITSLLVIRFLMNYVKKHSFSAFGIYRILLGTVLLLYFLI